MSEPSMFTLVKEEAVIGGAELRFTPLSVGATIRAKTMLKTIARAFSMFSGEDPNVLQRQQAVRDGDAFQNTTEPITPELMEATAQRREQAIELFFDAVDEEMLAALVLDALRHDDKFRDRYAKPGDLLNDPEISTEIFTELVTTMLKTNKKIAAPFRKMADAFMANIAARFAETQEAAEEESDLTIVTKESSGET